MTEAQDLHQLLAEHHQLDEQVRHFSELPHPTDAELVTESSLKKRKLRLKDLIAERARHALR
jgi:uncharacterized protein YdcH (DUF465 family)